MIDFEKSEKNRTRRIIFILVCSIIIILGSGVIAGVSWMTIKSPVTTTTIKTVTVPALVGRDISKAKALTKAMGLEIKIDKWVSNNVYPINAIVTQKPLPGRLMLPGGKVFIRVCSGLISKDDSDKAKDPFFIKDNPKPLPQPAIQARPLSDLTVVIDAGHQGQADNTGESIGPGSKTEKPRTTSGSRGIVSKNPEPIVTLKIAKKLEEYLKKLGLNIVMTRTTNNVNLSNIERAQIANNAKAALFVRIHCDGSTDQKKSGISVLYPQKSQWTEKIYEPSLRAATIVHDQLINATSAKDGGLVARSDLSGFNWSEIPVFLVETGFLSNPQEDISLNSDSYQDLVVKAIGDGIVQYLRQGNPSTPES